MSVNWPLSVFDLDRLRLRDELLRGFPGSSAGAAGVFPAVNIYDNGECYMVRAEVPGVERDALEITARGAQLTIGGQRVVESPAGQVSFHRREREGGQFRRTVTLPDRVDSSKVTASYRHGVLEVTLPRAAETQPRKVKVS